MNPKLYVMILVFLSLLQLCTSESRNDKIYIILTASVLPCPMNYSCMTIVQYFDSLNFVDQSNSSVTLTLYFLPGEHILETRNYSMTNASSIQLVGLPSSERNIDIICSGDGKMFFNEVWTLRLEAPHFI